MSSGLRGGVYGRPDKNVDLRGVRNSTGNESRDGPVGKFRIEVPVRKVFRKSQESHCCRRIFDCTSYELCKDRDTCPERSVDSRRSGL